MTTTHQVLALAPAAKPQPSAKPTGHLTFAGVVRSEWIKMVTLKTTWAMLAAIAVSIAGFAVLAGFSASGATSTGPGRRGEDPVSTTRQPDAPATSPMLTDAGSATARHTRSATGSKGDRLNVGCTPRRYPTRLSGPLGVSWHSEPASAKVRAEHES